MLKRFSGVIFCAEKTILVPLVTAKVRRSKLRAAALAVPLLSFLLTGFFIPPSQGHAASDEVFVSKSNLDAFGSLAVQSNAAGANSAFGKMRTAWAAEQTRFQSCFDKPATCAGPLRPWIYQIKTLEGMSSDAQLAGVNAFANKAIAYRSDEAAYGTSDHWALPTQSLLSGGDCEDYAIIKLFSLQALGVDKDAMRIVVLRDTLRDRAHALLSVKLKGKTYLLDSLARRVLRASDVPHYKPLYSVSNSKRWIHLSIRKRKARSVIAQK